MKILFTKHALFEMDRRQIKEEEVRKMAEKPQQNLPAKKGRLILQGVYFDGIQNREMLLRIKGNSPRVRNNYCV